MPINGLMTLAERHAVPHASPKIHPAKAQLARSIEKVKADREDDRKLAAWSKAVRDDDDWTDRYTGRKVKPAKTVGVISPNAAHAHHIEDRANQDVRYDVRNGVTLSYASHLKVEANELRIVGTRWFTVNGKRYINGRERLKFVEVK